MKRLIPSTLGLVLVVALGASLGACTKQIVPIDRTKLPAPAAAPNWSPPTVQTWTLANGLTVWFLRQDSAPLASAQLILPSGGSLDPGDKAGLTAFTIDMLDEGAGDRDALQLSKEFQRLATDYGGGATREHCVFSLDMLADNLEPSLALLADILTKPRMAAEDFERRKAQRVASEVAAEANPSHGRSVVIWRALFGDGRFGYPVAGTPDTLAKIGLADIKAQHAAIVRPGGAHMVIVGALSREAVARVVDAQLGGWEGAPSVPQRPLARNATGVGVHLVDYPGSAQSAIAVVRRATDRNAPDLFDAMVFNRTLGGAFVSRINMNLREDKGWTYGARSAFVRLHDAGLFMTYSNVKTDKTGASLKEILEEYRAFTTSRPLTQDELDKAVGGMLLGLPGRYESIGKVAGEIATMPEQGRPATWLQGWPANLRKVTLATARAAAAKVLHPERFDIVVAGDRALIEEELKTLGLPIQLWDARGNKIEPADATR